MDIGKIKLLLNTVKYLKPIQIYYRLYYFFRNRAFNLEAGVKPAQDIKSIKWENKLNSSLCYSHKIKCFTFLNIPHNFSNQIDWNYTDYGKLWTYNLNYFDFLNQEGMSKEIGIDLIDDYIKNDKTLKDGKEPYPISLRGINWVKFLSENRVCDSRVNKTLHQHYFTLLKNLEYHLLGNHLLENAFSLLFGAYYFQDEKLYIKSRDLLIYELNEQVLKDGAHFELSPMYHQIILSRLLDCIQLIKLNSIWKKDELLLFLEAKASLMVSWLKNITYSNGEIPMVNDAAYGIAPQSNELFSYAEEIGIADQQIPLSDSGYRKILTNNYELFIDVGNVGPDYQPGHAHSDTFNFELYHNKSPIIVDTGISTYEKNKTRQLQRSTYSHNTVILSDFEQSEIWGGFRVARRAKVFDLNETNNKISAKHNGYRNKGVIHCRSFQWLKNKIIIKDSLKISSEGKANAIFHLHSDIIKPEIQSDKVVLTNKGIIFQFYGYSSINIIYYDLCEGFNKTVKASKILVSFDKELETHINL